MRRVGSTLTWTPALCAAFLLGPEARAQSVPLTDSVLVFDHSEVQSSFPLFTYEEPGENASILVLGTLSGARPPLQGIDVGDLGREFTYIITATIFPWFGVWDGGPPGGSLEWGGVFYTVSIGYFRLYADDTPDHDFSSPSTFEDGNLLLEGNLPEYSFWSGAGYPCPQCYPIHGGSVEFTGGSLFSQVSRDGIGFQGVIGQTAHGEAPIDSLLQPGYSFPTHGKMGLYLPVGTRETTWGGIKRLFAK